MAVMERVREISDMHPHDFNPNPQELRNARTIYKENIPLEVQIMQKSLECIKATTGRNAPKQNKWLITEYDLEDCGPIGRGGFSTVSKARFRGTMVAVKTLKDVGNTREVRLQVFGGGYNLFFYTYAQDLEREIEIWSGLRHDHIVPFYGASTLTSPPYIVSRYMQHGNLVQYLTATPKADRAKLVSVLGWSSWISLTANSSVKLLEVSLGMYYLHEENVIHGDLKSVRPMYLRIVVANRHVLLR